MCSGFGGVAYGEAARQKAICYDGDRQVVRGG
jgi:hypothetical protein